MAKSDQQQQRVAARQKLIILLVGLPARGKTFLANKIMCYMNWYCTIAADTQLLFQASIVLSKQESNLYLPVLNALQAWP